MTNPPRHDERPSAEPAAKAEIHAAPFRYWATIVLVALTGLSVTAGIFSTIRRHDLAQQAEEFGATAEVPIQHMLRRADVDLEVLVLLSQLHAGRPTFNHDDLRASFRDFLRLFKEIRSLEWAPRVRNLSRSEFERTNHLTILEFSPGGDTIPAKDAPEFFPSLLIEPTNWTATPVGFNHASDLTRWRALSQAQDSGQPVMTSRQKLDPGGPGESPSVCWIFVPVFQSQAPPRLRAERRQELAGFIVASLDPERFAEAAFHPEQRQKIDYQLLDIYAAPSLRLLWSKPKPGSRPLDVWLLGDASSVQAAREIPIGARTWAIVCRPTAHFRYRPLRGSWAALGIGLLLTGLLTGYLYSILGRTSQIERTVALRTRELAEANRQLQSEIAERKKTEQAITASEARLQAILDNSTAVIYLKDTQGRYLLINRQFEMLFHLQREQIKGKTDHDVFLRETADAFRGNDLKALKAGTALEFEEIAPVDGQIHTYISIKFPMFNPDGLAYGVCGISTDITARVKAEKALEDSEALYHSLVACLPLNVVRKDLNGAITFGNERFCRTLGRPLEQLVGKNDFDLFPKKLAEKYVHDDQRVIATGEVFEDVEEHHTPEGEDLYMHVLKSPVYDAARRIVGLQVIFWDVTARKRAEKALEETAADLRRSNQELEQFAYVASHDLQEPLRMVASYTQLLARRYQGRLDAEADEFIRFAVDGAIRMQQLINDLLAYSRVGTHGKPFAPSDCEQILQTVFSNLKVAIEESGATINHDPLPTVRGDAVQLSQLFQNLLSNALKFRAEKPPRIHVGASRQADQWLFHVRDNGIGIEPQYFERIFVIFQRLHSPQDYAGTGIGLAICKKIVERHAGKIWVESQPGEGATFYFTLPAIC